MYLYDKTVILFICGINVRILIPVQYVLCKVCLKMNRYFAKCIVVKELNCMIVDQHWKS